MSNQLAINKLRDSLAKLYTNEASQRRIVDDSGLPSTSINFSYPSIDVWHIILIEAQKLDKVNDLISIALSAFPTNSELVRATQEFRIVVVPFLIATMTKDEAAALFDETIFKDSHISSSQLTEFRKLQTEWSDFRSLQEQLTHQGLPDLQNCYKGKREEWRPIYSNLVSNSSVREIVEEAFDYLNKMHKAPYKPILTPIFLSDYFFFADEEKQGETIELMEKLGGVVVIDAISMFHPLLSRQISDASISGCSHIAFLVISPVDATILPINQHIENIFDQDFKRACSRFRTKYDRFCEIDLGNILSLKRWFVRAIPDIVNLRPTVPLPENLQYVCQKILGGQQPRGYAQLFSNM